MRKPFPKASSVNATPPNLESALLYNIVAPCMRTYSHLLELIGNYSHSFRFRLQS